MSFSASQAYLESKPYVFLGNGDLYSSAVTITTEQANAITSEYEGELYQNLSADYDAGAQAIGTGAWDTLSPDQQTAIYDIAFNIGLHRTPNGTPPHYGIEDIKTLWPLLLSHNWSATARRILGLGLNPQRKADDATLINSGKTADYQSVIGDTTRRSSGLQ